MTMIEEIKSLREEVARLRERIAVLEARASTPIVYPAQPFYPTYPLYTSPTVAPTPRPVWEITYSGMSAASGGSFGGLSQ